ncbi:MAG TPA: 2-amino-4-hydroxy-6-hydroxymethyldihydropteridine diphosphokinase [Longimicrobiaceae bacterium]|nr:2-amino-4-hydroxy-6-hydroxymethyldihydropteridine diphosphokinase [Longimicrobiaceae bacterium]
MEPTTDVLFGLGANVGHPLRQLAEAVDALAELVEGLAVSSIYRTEPVGFAGQPDFFNLVARGVTALAPAELLRRVLVLEAWMGRERTFRNAPRVIDIDLLAYGALVLETPSLTLPHPGMPTRGFVLHPLAEIAPEWVHPVLGKTARELLAAAPPLGRVERVGTFARRG